MNALAAPASAIAADLDLDLPLGADNLHLSYGRHAVLRGVDLHLPRGQVLGLIGRNGAGKSSLIGCLLGLLRPQGGQARLFGAPALALDDARKQCLGYVPQQPQSFGWMKVGQLMGYLAQLYPQWQRAHADALLKRWDLDPAQAIGKLSPGQAQRLAVVRALAPRPALLVLDEPASALDPVARRELLRDIVEQAIDNGTTVLFSSHIISDLERVASHVAFLHEGRILLNQPLDELKSQTMRLFVPGAGAAQRPCAQPGFDARAAERGVDQAHRHVHVLLQLAREVVAGRGELRHVRGRGRLPAHRSGEIAARRGHAGLRHPEQADAVVAGAGDLRARVQAAMHLQLHVRLAAAQPHIADQHIGHAPGLAAAAGDQFMRTAGLERRQPRLPAAIVAGLRFHAPAGEFDLHLRAGRGLAPHRDRPVALHHRVILEQRVQQRRVGGPCAEGVAGQREQHGVEAARHAA